MHAFRRLSVWRKSHELTLRVYGRSDAIHRRYPALANQLLRAVHSIPANIAEGSGRASAKQFAQHLQIAIGSAREVDYFLQLAVDLGAITSKDHAILEARTDEVVRMMVGLRQAVLAQPPAKARPRRTSLVLAATGRGSGAQRAPASDSRASERSERL